MFLSRFAPALQSVLRFVTGALFLEHGTTDVFNFPPIPVTVAHSLPPSAIPMVVVAGLIELIGGMFIVFGFFSRSVAFICSVEMVIGYSLAHFTSGPLPANSVGESAILYTFVFLYLAAAGPGPYAVNQK